VLLDASRAGRASRAKEAVWIRNGRIAGVGTLGEVKRRAGRGAEIVDLGGGTLTPGFTDSHIHLVTWIRALEEPWLEAQDITNAILFLVSDEARFLTGAAIPVDAGYLLK